MSTKQQLELAKTKTGRVILHILSYLRDNKLEFHLKGIKREFA